MADQNLKSTAPTRHRFYCLTLVVAAFTICLVLLIVFANANAVDLPFNDQWTYLTPLFNGQGPCTYFFWQYGPHRVGIGGLVDWYLYGITGWNVCADVWISVAALVSSTIVALALMIRLRGQLSWSDAGLPLLLMNPIHWETITISPMPTSSILPLLLIILLAYTWATPPLLKQVFVVSTLGFLAFFTGYGICAAPVVISLAFLLWLRSEKKPGEKQRTTAALLLFCLSVAMAAFVHGYHWMPGPPGWHFPVPGWWNYPFFSALMFAGLLGFRSVSALAIIIGAGLMAIVFVVFVASSAKIWRREVTAQVKAIWVLTGTSLVYMGLASFGRLPIGLQEAFAWRYVTLMTPAICGLAIAADERLGDKPWKFRHWYLIAWMALAGIIWCNFEPEKEGAAVTLAKNRWIASYLKTHSLSAANKDSAFWVYAADPATQLVTERLHWLDQHHLSFFRTADDHLREEKSSVAPVK